MVEMAILSFAPRAVNRTRRFGVASRGGSKTTGPTGTDFKRRRVAEREGFAR